MREDPYYITDERPTKTVVDDVDSIPVVRLDDLPLPLPKGDARSRHLVRLAKTHVFSRTRGTPFIRTS